MSFASKCLQLHGDANYVCYQLYNDANYAINYIMMQNTLINANGINYGNYLNLNLTDIQL